MQDYMDEFVPRRKKSSAKPPKKAKHKHDYQPCIYEYDGVKLDEARGFIPELDMQFGTYCTICGKRDWMLGDKDRWFQLEWGPRRGWCRSVYTEEAKRELNPETRTLPTFRLLDYWKQKYVDLDWSESDEGDL